MGPWRWMVLPMLLGACSQPSGPAETPSLQDGGEDTPPDSGDPPGDGGSDGGSDGGVTGDVEDLGSACDGVSHPALVISEVLASNIHGIADADGDVDDWVELANLEGADLDLSGWSLTDDSDDPRQWALPPETLGSGQRLLIHASGKDLTGEELHASFSLSAVEGVVQLTAPDGCPVDVVSYTELYHDVSYGRTDAEPSVWGYFLEPTPGEPNLTESRPGFAQRPTLSPESGFHEEGVTVAVSTAQSGATLRVTQDGAAPDETSPLYKGPFTVSASSAPAVVRARAWVDGLWPSRIATATYSSDAAILADGLKVVSLVIDPFDLYDEATGIYAFGPADYSTDYPYFGANFWEDWERDLHISVWEPDGTLVVDQDAGVKIHGGYTRAFNQKNWRILPRGGYGAETIDYPIFPNEDLEQYEALVLEGVGDWCPTHTENAFVDTVFRDANDRRIPSIDSQAWEPAVVYLNGQFWGLYSFREKLDQHYIAAHHGADPDNLDRIECTADGSDNWWRLSQGDWEAFDALNEFVDTHDLSDEASWAEFTAMVDIDNLATTVLAEAYWGNADWWNNNLKLWREREDDAKWRWLVFDLGHGWGSARYDHLGTSVSFSGDGLPIANALQNEEFRVLLANQGSDFLNTNLAAEPALARLDAMHERIRPVIAEQYALWCGQPEGYWEANVENARRFVVTRPDVMWAQLQTHLDLDGTATVTLAADPPEAGTFKLTVVEVSPPFTGTFFTGIPVTVTALPADGWSFAGWSDEDLGEEATTQFVLEEGRSITARFE